MMAAAATLREFEALVGRVGGRDRLLLVAEAGAGEAGPRALLETFARDLFFGTSPPTREEKPPEDQAAGAAGAARGVRRVRVGAEGGRRRTRGRRLACPLLFVLFRAGALLQPRRSPERRRLREILRDLRGRLRRPRASLPAGFLAAVVGVAVLEEAPPPSASSPCCAPDPWLGPAEGEAARAHLEALLRRVFGARRRRHPGLRDTLQAAAYRPGGDQQGAAAAAGVREAACRALRAALQLRADEVATKKQRLPLLWPCLPWGRRRPQKEGDWGTAAEELREDALQDADEGVALTNITPNGKCEEAQGRAGS